MNKFANLKNKNEWNPLVEGGVGGVACPLGTVVEEVSRVVSEPESVQ